MVAIGKEGCNTFSCCADSCDRSLCEAGDCSLGVKCVVLFLCLAGLTSITP